MGCWSKSIHIHISLQLTGLPTTPRLHTQWTPRHHVFSSNVLFLAYQGKQKKNLRSMTTPDHFDCKYLRNGGDLIVQGGNFLYSNTPRPVFQINTVPKLKMSGKISLSRKYKYLWSEGWGAYLLQSVETRFVLGQHNMESLHKRKTIGSTQGFSNSRQPAS